MVKALWLGHQGHGCGFDSHSSRQDLGDEKNKLHIFRGHTEEVIKAHYFLGAQEF